MDLANFCHLVRRVFIAALGRFSSGAKSWIDSTASQPIPGSCVGLPAQMYDQCLRAIVAHACSAERVGKSPAEIRWIPQPQSKRAIRRPAMPSRPLPDSALPLMPVASSSAGVGAARPAGAELRPACRAYSCMPGSHPSLSVSRFKPVQRLRRQIGSRSMSWEADPRLGSSHARRRPLPCNFYRKRHILKFL